MPSPHAGKVLLTHPCRKVGGLAVDVWMDECDALLFSDGSLLMMSLSVRSVVCPSGHDEARTLLCAYVHWRQHVELHPLSLLKIKKAFVHWRQHVGLHRTCYMRACWIASHLLHERERETPTEREGQRERLKERERERRQ